MKISVFIVVECLRCLIWTMKCILTFQLMHNPPSLLTIIFRSIFAHWALAVFLECHGFNSRGCLSLLPLQCCCQCCQPLPRSRDTMLKHFSLQPGRWNLNCTQGQDASFLEKQQTLSPGTELQHQSGEVKPRAAWGVEVRSLRPGGLHPLRWRARGLHTLSPFLVIGLWMSSIQRVGKTVTAQ